MRAKFKPHFTYKKNNVHSYRQLRLLFSFWSSENAVLNHLNARVISVRVTGMLLMGLRLLEIVF